MKAVNVLKGFWSWQTDMIQQALVHTTVMALVILTIVFNGILRTEEDK